MTERSVLRQMTATKRAKMRLPISGFRVPLRGPGKTPSVWLVALRRSRKDGNVWIYRHYEVSNAELFTEKTKTVP
jgi:hypothetical protein